MASSSITPYQTNSVQVTHALQSTSATGVNYIVAGRSLATPQSVQITRKIGPAGSLANDHIFVRAQITNLNSTTGKPVTGGVTLDISIPRDTATVTQTHILNELGILSSLINDSSALAATTVARTALVSGQDL